MTFEHFPCFLLFHWAVCCFSIVTHFLWFSCFLHLSSFAYLLSGKKHSKASYSQNNHIGALKLQVPRGDRAHDRCHEVNLRSSNRDMVHYFQIYRIARDLECVASHLLRVIVSDKQNNLLNWRRLFVSFITGFFS